MQSVVNSPAPDLLTKLPQKIGLGRALSINLIRANSITLARYTGANGLDKTSIGTQPHPEFEALESTATVPLWPVPGSKQQGACTGHYSWRKVQGHFP